MTKKANTLIVSIFIVVFAIILAVILKLTLHTRNDAPLLDDKDNHTIVVNDSNSTFDYKIIHRVNEKHSSNYMISPVSIGYALSMLKDGARENTKDQLDEVLEGYTLPRISNVKDRISLANAIFIKEEHKEDISENYINHLKSTYNSEVLFDKFRSPKVLNDWTKEKTFGLIPKLVDQIDPNFVLGLVNAIAIDVEWKNKFECNDTKPSLFTKKDTSKIEVAMMNTKNTFKYFETNDAKGIIKDYALYNTKTGEVTNTKDNDTIELEYIAILPNDYIRDYINEFDKTDLEEIYKSVQSDENTDYYLNLPKYTYEFNYEDFMEALIDLGITDVFNAGKADLSGMTKEDHPLDLYVGQAIHKSKIELSENGTKAAAVTAMMVFKNSIELENDRKKVEITFNSPFLYIIKEKNSDNIWFFGTVYEPMTWKEHKACEAK